MLAVGTGAAIAFLYYENQKAKSLIDKERDITGLAQQVNAFVKGRADCVRDKINPDNTFDFDPNREPFFIKPGFRATFDNAKLILDIRKSNYNEARQNSLYGKIFKTDYNTDFDF